MTLWLDMSVYLESTMKPKIELVQESAIVMMRSVVCLCSDMVDLLSLQMKIFNSFYVSLIFPLDACANEPLVWDRLAVCYNATIPFLHLQSILRNAHRLLCGRFNVNVVFYSRIRFIIYRLTSFIVHRSWHSI